MPRRRIFIWKRAHVQAGCAKIRWLSVILAFVLLICFLTALNARIHPVLVALAETRVSNAVTEAVNEAVGNSIVAKHISYNDMVTMETDAAGRVSVLTSNLERANLLRTELLSWVLRAVSDLSSEDFSIPFGNLTGVSLFSGHGPTVTIRVLSTGTASAAFEHSFTDAGVNQTLHRIMLAVDVTVQILLPGETRELPVSTQVCVAETIIVGEVPNTYLEWEQ